MIAWLRSMVGRAGDYALSRQMELPACAVERKGPLDFVTEVDRDVERMLADEISRVFPDDGFIGEEGQRSASVSGMTWLVDPIDGTHNFVSGGTSWAISVGVVRDGQPIGGAVFAPAQNLLLAGDQDSGLSRNGSAFAARVRPEATIAHIGVSTWMPSDYDRWLIDYVKDELGIDYRRTGSAASSLLAVVQGEADLYVGFGEHAWDVAGGAALANAAGLVHNIDWSAGVPEGAITFVCGREALAERTMVALAEAEPALAALQAPKTAG
jgi:myo-inositol-1(or 4)-monophosphatase